MGKTFTKDGKPMKIIGEPIGEYTIIKRETEFQPYIAAWLFELNPENWHEPCWANGHYFSTYVDAVTYAVRKIEED